jgi:hypothetical protein
MCENPAVMAAPAPRRAEADEPPIEHELELKRARVRFWALFFGLLFFAIVLSLTILDQIQALFGV